MRELTEEELKKINGGQEVFGLGTKVSVLYNGIQTNGEIMSVNDGVVDVMLENNGLIITVSADQVIALN